MPSQQSQTPAIDLYESFEARRQSAKTLLGFSLIYLTGYFSDPPASFHPELINALESDKEKRLLVIGFRGSGKSTFGSLALPLCDGSRTIVDDPAAVKDCARKDNKLRTYLATAEAREIATHANRNLAMAPPMVRSAGGSD